ncbi:RNA polymerase sigma factor [Pedobacter sp.]|jgi:RNA polymerase sigma factor (sigma-70 family)|uniref:RNA polymerase sigma factor n=1 Tax=Pedobacter sp. TaxID=1411316 RepID=UPI002BA893EC|nr:sigma-70 family RNA polymerase sigma factor [Pedobacter sp.]HWW41303.1 sigma-70 family RNA polymerase sigma factor [Pedobacter sp.]
MRANYNSYEDAQLAELYNRKDRNAFDEIYERYWDIMYIHAKNMLHDADQAKDVVQELFLSLLNRMGELKLKATFSSFLYQSIRFIVFDLIRHNQVKIDYVARIQATYQDADYTTDNLVIENELKAIIEKEIERLPPKMRAIFEMSKKAYLSNKEIALATNTSEENIKRQLRQASARVRAKIASTIYLQIMVSILWLNRHF